MVAPQRSVTSTLRVKIALGLTGQTSSQTTQLVSIAQGRQRPWLQNAVPVLIGPLASNGPLPSFSAIEISRMAPVGQTWLHRVQFSSHQPIFEIMIGVQSPSRPASN